jgi:toxin-antitoxin system PIN domain toxin
VIAVDTNLLVYAHRKDSPWHGTAHACLTGLAEGGALWAIPWPCLHEFLGVATHPRIYSPPTPLEQAVEQVEAWLESPTVQTLGETEGYWEHAKPLVLSGRICGPQIHDARVVALCLQHGVRELWSADRDFSRFPALKVRNPLLS